MYRNFIGVHGNFKSVTENAHIKRSCLSKPTVLSLHSSRVSANSEMTLGATAEDGEASNAGSFHETIAKGKQCGGWGGTIGPVKDQVTHTLSCSPRSLGVQVKPFKATISKLPSRNAAQCPLTAQAALQSGGPLEAAVSSASHPGRTGAQPPGEACGLTWT